MHFVNIFAVICAVIPLATGCAVDTDAPTTPFVSDDGPELTEVNDDDVGTGTCEEEAVRDCKVWVDERNCFVGVQVCENAQWGDCLAPEDVE